MANEWALVQTLGFLHISFPNVDRLRTMSIPSRTALLNTYVQNLLSSDGKKLFMFCYCQWACAQFADGQKDPVAVQGYLDHLWKELHPETKHSWADKTTRCRTQGIKAMLEILDVDYSDRVAIRTRQPIPFPAQNALRQSPLAAPARSVPVVSASTWRLADRIAVLSLSPLVLPQLEKLTLVNRSIKIVSWAGGLSPDGRTLFALAYVPQIWPTLSKREKKELRPATIADKRWNSVKPTVRDHFAMKTARLRGGDLTALFEVLGEYGGLSLAEHLEFSSQITRPMPSPVGKLPSPLKKYTAAIPRPGEIVGAGAAEIGEQSIGHKLLLKMGWQKGTALGKDGVGVLVPVEQRMRNGTAGIGSTVPPDLPRVLRPSSTPCSLHSPHTRTLSRTLAVNISSPGSYSSSKTGIKSHVSSAPKVQGLSASRTLSEFPDPQLRHTLFKHLNLEEIAEDPSYARLGELVKCFQAPGKDLFLFHIVPLLCVSLGQAASAALISTAVDEIWTGLPLTSVIQWVQGGKEFHAQCMEGNPAAIQKILPKDPSNGSPNYHLLAHETVTMYLKSNNPERQASHSKQGLVEGGAAEHDNEKSDREREHAIQEKEKKEKAATAAQTATQARKLDVDMKADLGRAALDEASTLQAPALEVHRVRDECAEQPTPITAEHSLKCPSPRQVPVVDHATRSWKACIPHVPPKAPQVLVAGSDTTILEDLLEPQHRQLGPALVKNLVEALSVRFALGTDKVVVGRTIDGWRVDYNPQSENITGIASRLQMLMSTNCTIQEIEMLLLPLAQWNKPSTLPKPQQLREQDCASGETAFQESWIQHAKAYCEVIPITLANAVDTVDALRISLEVHSAELESFYPTGKIAVNAYHLERLFACFEGPEVTTEVYEDRIERCLYIFDFEWKKALGNTE